MQDKSILLVDDERLILHSIERELKLRHFGVTPAASGEDAIAALESDHFDLVITDLMMTGLDGFQVLKKAKKISPHTSVIIVTGYSDITSAIDALRLGADDYLQKPFDMNELFFRMSRCFDKQELARQLTTHKELLNQNAVKLLDLATANTMLTKEISKRKAAEATLRKREAELEAKNKSLEEANIAMQVLLAKRGADKKRLEEKMIANINELILPYVEKLKKTNLDSLQGAYVGKLEAHLNTVYSRFSKGISYKFLKLSPVETRIANYVREGRTTKEIADLLHLSPRTIETHRRNIRKKIGITNKKETLRTILLNAL